MRQATKKSLATGFAVQSEVAQEVRDDYAEIAIDADCSGYDAEDRDANC